jgi:hypothetical protein
LSFTYKAVSGARASRATTVVFTLDQPLAANGDRLVLAAIDKNGRFVLPAPGVLANDSGTGELRAELVVDASAGKVVLGANGGLTYAPPPGGIPKGGTTFTYRLRQGAKLSEPVPVQLRFAVPSDGSSSLRRSR